MYGNIKISCWGISNTNSHGIFITLGLILLSGIFMVYINLTFIDNPLIRLILISFSGLFSIISIILSIYFSRKDPGFIIPNTLEISEYDKINPVVTIKEKHYLLKYCNTCRIIRDIRVFHCKECNLCVERHGK